MSSAPERRPVTIRRAPKIIPFLVLGALLGLICAGIIAFTGPESSQFSRGTVLGFFSALLLIPGLLLGAIVALVFDWLSVRRSRTAMAESTGPGTTREPVDEDDAAENLGPVDEDDAGAIHETGEPEGRADANGDDADRNR
jgi:hypothetical protein